MCTISINAVRGHSYKNISTRILRKFHNTKISRSTVITNNHQKDTCRGCYINSRCTYTCIGDMSHPSLGIAEVLKETLQFKLLHTRLDVLHHLTVGSTAHLVHITEHCDLLRGLDHTATRREREVQSDTHTFTHMYTFIYR